jgi:hypothetical protein
MKVLFLIFTFIPLIMAARAKRPFNQYTCQVSFKHANSSFYLKVPEEKEVEVDGWKVIAGIKRVDDLVEVSLGRHVVVMDATYQKNAKRSYPMDARMLPVELEHSFGGRSDVFDMICYPRDP